MLAVPSSGLHSNGYSLVRKILKNTKIDKFLKKELLIPTKIYTKEILGLVNKGLINSSANITGGGIIENINRSVSSINGSLSFISSTITFLIYLIYLYFTIPTLILYFLLIAAAGIYYLVNLFIGRRRMHERNI